MQKSISTLVLGASLLCPMNLDVNSSRKEKIENQIEEVLKSDRGSIEIGGIKSTGNENLRRQTKIKNLIPQIKEPIILGDVKHPNVAITIDDGYGKESIEYMLNLFEKNDVRATFFVIGVCLKKYPDLWKRAMEQGHEICNHTQTHGKYFKGGNESARFEIEIVGWENDVKQVLGEGYFAKMKRDFPFFRFPGGHGGREKDYLNILKKHGYIPIGWGHTTNSKDGVVNNGDIFLWHFKNQDTSNVRKNLELILQNDKQPRTVSDIITSDGYDEPIGWHNRYKKK